MINVGDIFESKVAIYKILGETKYKWRIERINKKNHPFAPNKKFPVNLVWKKQFGIDRLKKVTKG